MKYLIYIILILLVLIFSLGVFEPLGLNALVPSLLLLIVICLSMEHTFTFVLFALLGGVWLDVFYGLPVGSFSAVYLITGFLGYAIFRHWLAETNWKYYLAIVATAEIFMLLWLWAYTNVALRFHFGLVALSAAQLLHYTPSLIISALLAAFPLYSLVNFATRLGKKFNRQPLQLS